MTIFLSATLSRVSFNSYHTCSTDKSTPVSKNQWVVTEQWMCSAHPPSSVSTGKIQGLNNFAVLLCRSCRAERAQETFSPSKTTGNTKMEICVSYCHPTSGGYLSLLCCFPLAPWHSCWAAHWWDSWSNGPRRKQPHWCRESRQRRGRSCGGLAYWPWSGGNSRSASRLSHPPVGNQLNKSGSVDQWVTKFEILAVSHYQMKRVWILYRH